MSRVASFAVAPLVCAVLVLTRCWFEFSIGSTIDKEELEKQVMGALSEKDRRPADVTCPGDLEPEVDATTRCTATGRDGAERDATVTVTGVGEDDRVRFDVVLAGQDGAGQAGAGQDGTGDNGSGRNGTPSAAPEGPSGGDGGQASDVAADDEIDRTVLARQAAESLNREVGQHLGDLGCPEHVKADVGARTRCVLTNPEGTQFGVTVEVTEVDAERQSANFHVQVDEQPLGGGR